MTGIHGARVVITRPNDRSHDLAARLQELGATVIRAPMISIEPINDAAIGDFITSIENYDLAVFTSATAVLRVVTPDVVAMWPAKLQAAAIGPASMQALQRAGLQPEVFNEGVTGADLVRAIPGLEGKVVFLPQGDRNEPTVEQMLKDAGATVRTAVIYRTTNSAPSPAARGEIERGVDVAVFYSPSAAQSFGALKLDMKSMTSVCVGPTTAAEAAKLGAPVLIARDTTLGAIVEAVMTAIQKRSRHVQ